MTRGDGFKLHQGSFQLQCLEKIILTMSGEALQQATQGGDSITIPKDTQGNSRRHTEQLGSIAVTHIG